jgi:tripartite-type tricarboxylate transporter receptor subunit TctC
MSTSRIIAAIVALTFPPVTAAAQDWPTRPVTMVIPFTAGGPTDVLGRLIAPRLSELLGQQVIVVNVGGAGGMTGTARVARAAPDGYQFVLGGAGPNAVNQTLYRHPLYNAATDFAPVALIAEQPLVLIARADLPIGNLQEFIAYVKANQATMQYGSPGVGSTQHLACALLNAALGVSTAHIPYRGGGPAMQEMIAGRIDYQCSSISIVLPQVETKTIEAIATLTLHGSPILQLPSAHEQGLNNFDASTWSAFFLPKATPAAIVRRLHDATVMAIDTPIVRQRLSEAGFDVVTSSRRSPEYLKEFVESEVEKWGGAIKAAGLSGEE